MYLIINGQRHSCTQRKKTGRTVQFLSVSPAPEAITGLVKLFRDDGFLLCEDQAEDYGRVKYLGTVLTMSNDPEPVPEDPARLPEYRLSLLEQQAADMDALGVELAYQMTLIELGITE